MSDERLKMRMMKGKRARKMSTKVFMPPCKWSVKVTKRKRLVPHCLLFFWWFCRG